jgi:hypothetical protein
VIRFLAQNQNGLNGVSIEMARSRLRGLIEVEGAGDHNVTGARDQNWYIALGFSDPRQLVRVLVRPGAFCAVAAHSIDLQLSSTLVCEPIHRRAGAIVVHQG